MKTWQLILVLVLCSVLLTEIIVAMMGLLLKGTVPIDYLLTGLVASCFVATLIVVILTQFREQLAENTLILRTIIESQPECVKLLAANGTLLQMNPAGLAMIEADSENQVIGQSIQHILLPEYRAAFGVLIKQIFKGGTGNLEFEICGLKGTHRWLETHAVPLSDSNGNITALLSITRDITARKRAEQLIEQEKTKLHSLIQAIPDLIWLKNEKGVYQFCNPIFESFFGAKEADILGKTDYDFVDKEQADFFVANDTKVICEGVLLTNEEHLIFADGGYQGLFETIKTPLRDNVGNIIGVLGISRDITERRQIESIKRANEEQLRAFYELDLVGLAIMSPEKSWIRINKCLCAMLEYSEQELRLMTWTELTHPDDLAADVEQFEKLLVNEINGYSLEKRFISRTGKIILTNLVVRCVRKSSGEVDYVTAMVEDITERKQAELELCQNEEQLQLVLVGAHLGFWDWNIVTNEVQRNAIWAEILGYTDEEIQRTTQQWEDFIYPDDRDRAWQSIYNVLEGKIPYHNIEYRMFHKDGSLRWILDHANVVQRDINGKPTRMSGTHTDITERKATEEHINNLAFYDPLTQLPNRRLLSDRLKHGIEVNHRTHNLMAVLLVDLDKFKTVNDNLGHAAGDKLLQQVASRIKASVRESDTVARLGGDEFVILLENVEHDESITHVANTIIHTLSQPFTLPQNHEAYIGASIGISIHPQHGDTVEALMDHADAALYHAKDQGRGIFAYFSEELTSKARERLALESRLRKAIEQHELRVYFQPQLDIVSNKIMGAEALVRWHDPLHGCITPNIFISLAEETGLIMPLGEFVLRETCRLGREWLDAGLPAITLAVNVSASQFRRCDINALVTQVLSDTGFPAESLELEITESGLMDNQQHAMTILNNLHKQGVQLAIDDFGTGYSSLAYLKYFPLDMLKIDKTFIDDIPFLQGDMAITATIIAMAHHLGFKVLAEGVETVEQLAFLREHGCDSYQGYLYSKPIPASEFAQLLLESSMADTTKTYEV